MERDQEKVPLSFLLCFLQHFLPLILLLLLCCHTGEGVADVNHRVDSGTAPIMTMDMDEKKVNTFSLKHYLPLLALILLLLDQIRRMSRRQS